MRAYSMDLRERVVAACDEGLDTRAEVAERFSVSESWVRRLLQRRRETGSMAPKRHGGGQRPAFDSESLERLRQAVAERPDATLAELRDAVGATRGITAVHGATVALGLTHKKVAPRRRAGPTRLEGRTRGVAGRVRGDRPVPARLPGRDRGDHGDDPHAWPGAARPQAPCRGAARPLEGGHADRRGPARRGRRLPGLRRGHRLDGLRDLRRGVPGADAEAR